MQHRDDVVMDQKKNQLDQNKKRGFYHGENNIYRKRRRE